MLSPIAGTAAAWSAASTSAQKAAGWSSAGSSAIHATVRLRAVRDDSHCATRDVLPKPVGAEMSVNLAAAPRSSRAASLGRATRPGRGLGRFSLVVTRGLGIGSSPRASPAEVIISARTPERPLASVGPDRSRLARPCHARATPTRGRLARLSLPPPGESPPRSHHLVMPGHHVLSYRPEQRREPPRLKTDQDQGAEP
jgi:hypothetical protein